MSIHLKEIEALVQPITAKDPRLAQILRKLAGAIAADETIAVDEIILNHYVAIRFELPGVQVVATDVLPVRYTVRLPRDPDNSLLFKTFQLQLISLSTKVAAVGSAFIMDCLVSVDKGTTWKSLFGQDNSTKPTLPIGLFLIKNSFFSVDQLHDEDMLRIDVIQADGTIAGEELQLIGNYVT